MGEQAKVTSTEALEEFRASLIVFMTKAKRAIDDASDDVKKTRQWIQFDQRTHWEGEYRRKRKALEQANAELMSAKLGADAHRQSALMARQMAVTKAQRDVADVEAKMRKLKGWTQNFDGSSDPVVKRMDRLRQTIDELPKAIAYLVSIQNVLAAYSDSAGPISTSTSGLSEADAPPAVMDTAPPE